MIIIKNSTLHQILYDVIIRLTATSHEVHLSTASDRVAQFFVSNNVKNIHCLLAVETILLLGFDARKD